MRTVIFKSEKNINKINTQSRIKIEVASKIIKIKRVLQKQRNMKNLYFCGSGTQMLNNYEVKGRVSRYEWFHRKGNVKIQNQQAKYKGD